MRRQRPAVIPVLGTAVLLLALATAPVMVLAACGDDGAPVSVPSATYSEHAVGATLISWSEAASRIGERQRVEGPVASVSRRGSDALLNIGLDAPDPERFVAVIPARLLKDLSASPAQLYGGRLVRVTGKITKDDGVAAIVVRSLKQIAVE